VLRGAQNIHSGVPPPKATRHLAGRHDLWQGAKDRAVGSTTRACSGSLLTSRPGRRPCRGDRNVLLTALADVTLGEMEAAISPSVAGWPQSQEELAEAASLSPRSVSDLERGVNRTATR